MFGGMVRCRPPPGKTSSTKLTCDQVSFFPSSLFVWETREKKKKERKKKTPDGRLIRTNLIYLTKIENLTRKIPGTNGITEAEVRKAINFLKKFYYLNIIWDKFLQWSDQKSE